MTEQNKLDEARTTLQAQIQAYPDGDMAKDAYWMLLAVHGLSLPLIGRLSAPDADGLYRSYAKAYRRWERLPVQEQVLAALKKQAAS